MTNQVAFAAMLTGSLMASGCLRMHLRNKNVVRKPARHSLQLEKLLMLSDFRIAPDHKLVGELQVLRDQVIDHLQLPLQRDEVTVYLFSDQSAYQEYLSVTWPDLPNRRAYFVGTPRELAVYTFWGNRTQEDLRHEYTHGVLHSTLHTVPLWLDEGLAEYFEVSGREPGGINREHARELSAALANGWVPDMRRLESITEFSDMQRMDYQEAWAWVHFMVHSTPDTKQVLIDYLHSLRRPGSSEVLSESLGDLVPTMNERLRAYVGSLQTPAVTIRAQKDQG